MVQAITTFRTEIINGKPVQVRVVERTGYFHQKGHCETENICKFCGHLKKGTRYYEEGGFFACSGKDCRAKAKAAEAIARSQRIIREAAEERKAQEEAREYDAECKAEEAAKAAPPAQAG